MGMLTPLNLDKTLPKQDSYHASPAGQAGTVRYTQPDDPMDIEARQRVEGDIVNRMIRIEAALNGVIQALQSNPATASDLSGFILQDGSVPFTKPVAGKDPEQPNHLVTLGYLSEVASTLSEATAAVANAVTAFSASHPRTFDSGWIVQPYQAGLKQRVAVPLTGFDPAKLIGMFVSERVDVAVATQSAPSPTADYRYRTIPVGGAYGYRIDDWWVEGTNVILLIANQVSTAAGYTGSNLSVVRSRALRVVVQTLG